MAFLTRKIDCSKFDDGSSTDVYEISDGGSADWQKDGSAPSYRAGGQNHLSTW
jgi:hypothetical protein